MTRYVTVRVMQADIKRGKRRDMASCPIALAINRTLSFTEARVHHGNWCGYPAYLSPRLHQPLSRRASRWVRAFDKGDPVQPATFRLLLP